MRKNTLYCCVIISRGLAENRGSFWELEYQKVKKFACNMHGYKSSHSNILFFFVSKGSTTYVLSANQGVYQLWNAHTGEKFSVNDAYCPLQNIACLINSENVSLLSNISSPSVAIFQHNLLRLLLTRSGRMFSSQGSRIACRLTSPKLNYGDRFSRKNIQTPD